MKRIKEFFAMAFILVLWCFCAPAVFAAPDPLPTPPPAPQPLTPEQVAVLVDENKRIKAELEAAKKKPEPDPKADDADLETKAKQYREAKEKKTREDKTVETAIAFNMGAEDFVKKNSDLLPKDFLGILTAAAKESYDTALAKAAAIKASMISSFFGVQANVDSLTPSQKADLDEYLRMTKTVKEDKAPQVFANIFEPTLESLRRVKKAEELGRARNGLSNGTDTENAYRDKLIKGSQKFYLGEKQEA